MTAETRASFIDDVRYLAALHQAKADVPRVAMSDQKRFARIEVLLLRLEKPELLQPVELLDLVNRLRKAWATERRFLDSRLGGSASRSNVIRGPWHSRCRQVPAFSGRRAQGAA